MFLVSLGYNVFFGAIGLLALLVLGWCILSVWAWFSQLNAPSYESPETRTARNAAEEKRAHARHRAWLRVWAVSIIAMPVLGALIAYFFLTT